MSFNKTYSSYVVIVGFLSLCVGHLCGQEFDAFIDYDPSTGHMSVDHIRDHRSAALEVRSLSAAFNPVASEWLSVFDSSSNNLRFVLRPSGVDTVDFGAMGPINADPAVLAADLCVTGARLAGGQVGDFALRVGAETWPTTCSFAGLPPAPVVPMVTPSSSGQTPSGPFFGNEQEYDAYIDYDPDTGNLSVDHIDSHRTTALEIESLSRAFTPVAFNWQSPYDVSSNEKRFALVLDGADELDLGRIGPIGADPAVLAADLCVRGARLSGGYVGTFAVRVGDNLWPASCSQAGLPSAPVAPALEPGGKVNFDEPFYLDYDSETGMLSVEALGRSTAGFTLSHDGRPFLPWRDRPDIFLAENLPTSLTVWAIEPFETMMLGEVIHPGTPAKELAASMCFHEQGRRGQGDSIFIRSNEELFSTACVRATDAKPLQVEEVLDYIVDPTADVGIVVDEGDQSLVVHVPNVPDGASQPLTRIELKSEVEIFRPGFQTDGTLDGVFDSLTSKSLVKDQPDGFGTVNFGPILLPGVTSDQVENLIQITGLLSGGQPIGSVDVVHWRTVPEPTAYGLLVVILLVGTRRGIVRPSCT